MSVLTPFRYSLLMVLIVLWGNTGLPAQDAAALAMRARVHLYDTWNFDSVSFYLGSVIGAKDAPAFAYTDYGWYLWLAGKKDEGLSMIGKAAKMDPADKQLSTWYAWALLWDGKLDEARRWIDKALKISPDYGEALFVASLISSQEGNHTDALKQARLATQANADWRGGVPLALAYAGKTQAAITESDMFEKDLTAYDALLLTEVYTSLGDSEKALDYLEIAFEMRHPFTPWIQYWPGIKPLSSERRFNEIVHKLNLPN